MTRTLTIPAFAKVNLALTVGGRRPDGFHEIQTIFHTVSLADRLTLYWTGGAKTGIVVTSTVDIPGENIAARAAHEVLAATGARGHLAIHIDKRIPMGGGMGGGSTDAAAVLHALPRLTGRALEGEQLAQIAARLGSDVPFFLHGGCALGFGRGEQLYPLPDARAPYGVLIAPGVHVSTAEAYRALARPPVAELTSTAPSRILKGLQSLAWALDLRSEIDVWATHCGNEFEDVVFRQYPVLQSLKRKLERMGAAPALMTGSGAAIFGFFRDRSAVQAAIEKLSVGPRPVRAHAFSLLSRSRYLSQLAAARVL